MNKSLLAAAMVGAASAFLDLESIATNIGNFNTGMMKAMQQDMTDETTDCIVQAEVVNDELANLFADAMYTTGSVNFGELMENGQVMLIQLMDQFDKCNFNNYLVQLDLALSQLPQLVGSISNLATQVGTGWEAEDTTVFLALNEFKNVWEDRDWDGMGTQFQLFASQMLKVEAPATKQDITPVGRRRR